MRRFVILSATAAMSAVLLGCGANPTSNRIGEGLDSPRHTKSAAPASGGDFAAADSSVPAESPATVEPMPAPEFARQPPQDVLPLPEPPRQRPMQSGTLTAGSLNDVKNFADYRNYLSEVLQRDRREQLPRFAVGRPLEVKVQNEQGDPVGGAVVTIKAAGTKGILLAAPTHSNGRLQALSAWDQLAGEARFEITVSSGNATRTVEVTAAEAPWTITLDAPSQLPQALDLCLVIDTTGSMQDELDYLKTEIDSIAARVHSMFPKVSQRYALICYRDEGDAYVSRTFDFTDDLSDFRGKLAAQSADGGGDYPEAMHLALEQANRLSWRSGNTARVTFLVADAPPHTRFSPRTMQAVNGLRSQGVTVYPVAGSGAEDRAEFVLRAIGFLTQGQYLFLTDHSGVGNPHATPHAPKFEVERLDRLMLRMVACELSARELLPQEIIATESDNPQPTVIQAVPQQQQSNVVLPREPVHGCGTTSSASQRWLTSLTKWQPRWLILVAAAAFVGVVEVASRRGWLA